MTVYEAALQPKLFQPKRFSRSDLSRRLSELEAEYGMTTDEFMERWRSGDLSEDLAFVEWARIRKLLTRI